MQREILKCQEDVIKKDARYNKNIPRCKVNYIK